jgi:hypothetical protein
MSIPSRNSFKKSLLSARLSEKAWACLGVQCQRTGQTPTAAVNLLIESVWSESLPKNMQGLPAYSDRYKWRLEQVRAK